MDSAFWIDYDYDRARSDDGVSRYHSYIRSRISGLAEVWDGTYDDAGVKRSEWAAECWRIATGPVMAPGYVRSHPLIQGSRLYRSGWDGALLASVALTVPPPAALVGLPNWGSWPTELSGGDYMPVSPYEEQISRNRYVLTVSELAFALDYDVLPEPPAGPGEPIEHIAADTVGALVAHLNGIVTPLIAALSGARR
jgi:hypothetical protein